MSLGRQIGVQSLQNCFATGESLSLFFIHVCVRFMSTGIKDKKSSLPQCFNLIFAFNSLSNRSWGF